MKYVLSMLSLFILVACSSEKGKLDQSETPYTLVKPKVEWVSKRIAESKARLSASEAGLLVWESMEYHGSLEQWWTNGPVYFRFNYQPKPGTGTARDTYELADYWSSRTRHQRVANPAEEYGWDGKQSWFYPASAETPYNTRFWALTPYYFAGMPFVFADEGVSLSKEADVAFEGSTHHIIRVTFGENVGDAPDDYYVLYINAESHRLAAIRYVVSYPAYFQNGGHSQEKLMTYEGEQNIEGIIFPEKHRTYMWEADGTIGAYVTDITLSEIAFKPNTEVSYFEIPEGSAIMQGLDK
jgi:hypothetical protein